MPRSRKSDPVAIIREISESFPEVEDKAFGGHFAPAFRVRDKIFVKVNEDLGGFTAKAPPGAQQALIASDPDRYYYPDYVGSKGWIGVRLIPPVDRDELAEIIEDSYRLIAPKRLVRQLEAEAD